MEQIPLAVRSRLAEISDRMEQINEAMDLLGPGDKYPFRSGEILDALYREWCELRDEVRDARAWRDSRRG
jgi:hypothetical protein